MFEVRICGYFMLDVPFKRIETLLILRTYVLQTTTLLHGPPMFAIKAKIYEVLYKQSSSIAFDETSSYWSAPKNS